jgi:hypothetical protein
VPRSRRRDRRVPRVAPAADADPGAPSPAPGSVPRNVPPASTLDETSGSGPVDAGGTPKITTGRVSELVTKATRAGATSEDVDAARAELARVLAAALDLALDAGDLDQVLKLSDRLTKLLPSGGSGAPPAPEPPGGGGHGSDDGGAPSSAERFRLVSGELGD